MWVLWVFCYMNNMVRCKCVRREGGKEREKTRFISLFLQTKKEPTLCADSTRWLTDCVPVRVCGCLCAYTPVCFPSTLQISTTGKHV